MRVSRRFLALLLVILALSVIAVSNQAYASPIRGSNPNRFESHPKNHVVLGTGFTVTDPAKAYDTLYLPYPYITHPNDTYANIPWAAKSGTFQLDTFTNNVTWGGGATPSTITQVDIKINWEVPVAPDKSQTYAIYYTVSPDVTKNYLVTASTSTRAKTTDVWSAVAEPNNAVWEWADLPNLKVVFEIDGAGGASTGNVYAYEVWASVVSPDTKLSVDPPSIIDDTKTPGSKVTYTLKVSEVYDLGGVELRLKWNPNVLDIIHGFFVGTAIQDDTLIVDGLDEEKPGWNRAGSSPFLDATDDGNYVYSNTHAETIGDFTFENLIPPASYITIDYESTLSMRAKADGDDYAIVYLTHDNWANNISYILSPSTAYSWVEWDVSAYLDTELKINGSEVCLEYGKFGKVADNVYFDALQLDIKRTITFLGDLTVGPFFPSHHLWFNQTGINASEPTVNKQYIWVSFTLPMGTKKTYGKSGTGIILQMDFTVAGTGTTDLVLYAAGLGDTYAENIPSITENGYFSNAAVPEFPLGLIMEAALGISIIAIWWRKKRKFTTRT